MFRFFPVVAACVLCEPAAAQAIYKCSVNSKIAYGDRPCADGTSTELAVPAAAPVIPRETARRDRETLLQLEKLRLTRELQAEREQGRAQRAAAEQRRKCDRLRLHRKWADEDLARAAGTALDPARRKARRQAEALAVECPA